MQKTTEDMRVNGVNGLAKSPDASADDALPPDAVLTSRAVQPPTSRKPSPARREGKQKQRLPTHLYRRLPPYCLKADGTPDYVRLILTSRVYDVVQPTPLQAATGLSSSLGCSVLLKREDLQPVFSFKIRGAYNLMSSLSDEEKWRGVVACSAGNHAQGVALAGSKLGIACTIVMPMNTPAIKWVNVERLGAKVVLHGSDFDEAKAECNRLAEAHGLTNIPPYDDPFVIAGQGTATAEILRQADPNTLDAVFCCVGGGGLLAGAAAYIKAVAPPHVKVIGVETHDADAMTQSMAKGERVLLSEVGLFSDGTAVRLVGEESFRVCNELVDEMISVSNDEICAAIKDVFEDTRSTPEPAGALAVAGMKKYVAKHNLFGSGKRLVAMVSGANINFDRLRFVVERAEIGERREALLSVIIPEKPGSFLALVTQLAPRFITEFSYRFSTGQAAHVILAFYLSSRSDADRQEELAQLTAALEAEGMQVRNLGDDELAKSHARYLVGGRKNVPHERLFRFEFPERPGALIKFLKGLQAGWNISLWHYRNQGGDLGKILAGVQIPPADYDAFDDFLAHLGYTYIEETHNPVYRDFLIDELGTAPPTPTAQA